MNVGRWVVMALAALGVACASSAHAEDSYSAEFEGEVRLDESVSVVRASVPYAHVRVSDSDRTGVWARARVELRHPVRGRAEEILRESAGLVLMREGEVARLEVEILPPGEPEGVDTGASVGVELEIEVPKGVGVTLTCQFGDVDIVQVSGPIVINAASGEIRLRDAPGDAVLSATFGKVTVQGGGHVRVSGSSAEVRIRGVQSAHIENQFGGVTAAEVAGELRVDARSASVTVDGVGGAIEIGNSFGPVSIRGSQGRVKVQTSGAISVSEVVEIPEGSQWLLATQFHPVELTLPATADVEVQAFSHFGPIESDFAMERRHGWNEEATIRLGDASRATIEIRNTGDIRVLRQREGK